MKGVLITVRTGSTRLPKKALLEINASSATGVTNIYDVNYNVLKVMSGMGGLAYSN